LRLKETLQNLKQPKTNGAEQELVVSRNEATLNDNHPLNHIVQQRRPQASLPRL
jgi:hypothetical protein